MNDEEIKSAIDTAMGMLVDFSHQNEVEVQGTIVFQIGDFFHIEHLTPRK